VKYIKDNYTPSDSAGSPCKCPADGKWKGFLSFDLSVRYLSSLASLDRSPGQKCASWRHAFFVRVNTCCEPSPLVWASHRVIFHRTWDPSVVENFNRHRTYSSMIQLIMYTSESFGGVGQRNSSAVLMSWCEIRNVAHCLARLEEKPNQ
jgi:hypothetical protein